MNLGVTQTVNTVSVLLGVLVVVLMSSGFWFYDRYRVASILLPQFAILLLALKSTCLGLSRRKSIVFVLMTFLVLASILSSLVYGPMKSSEISFYVLYLTSIFLVACFRASDFSRALSLAYCFVRGFSLLYVAVALIFYALVITGEFSVARVEFLPWGFENIRYWSHVATWILPIISLGLIFERDHLTKLAWWVVTTVCALWWWIVFLSIARGTMLGLFSGALAILVFAPRVIKREYLRVFFTPFLLGVMLWLLLEFFIPWLVFGEVAHKSLNTTTSGRIPQWKEAFAMSLQNFPFGMGVQSWLTHEVITDTYRVRFGHPHNMYLLWAAEYGWLFVASLFVGVMWILRRSFLRARDLAFSDPKRALILLALLHSFIAACTHAGVSAVFIGPASLLVGWFVMVAVVRMTFPIPENREEATTRSAPLWFRGSLATVLFCSFIWNWSSVLDYKRASERDQICYFYLDIHTGNGPRFWLHGDFPRPPSLACDKSRIPENVRRALD